MGEPLKYLLLALAWTAYCTLHSAMISETATGFLKRRLGDSLPVLPAILQLYRDAHTHSGSVVLALP